MNFYGYELMEEIKQFSKIEIAEGTLYPLLNRLKKEKLVDSKWVEQESGIPRKYYHVTQDGMEALNGMHAYWDDLNVSLKKSGNEKIRIQIRYSTEDLRSVYSMRKKKLPKFYLMKIKMKSCLRLIVIYTWVYKQIQAGERPINY